MQKEMKSSILTRITLTCFLFFFLMFNSLSYTQTAEEQLVGLLERITLLTAAMYGEGYNIVHIEVDRLAEGQSRTSSRTLTAGLNYKLIGIGGVGISDLDIELYDENRILIDEDEGVDNLPEVEVTPQWSGKFYIDTSVYSVGQGYSEDRQYYFCYIIGFKG
jgi:hypothetical protein